MAVTSYSSLPSRERELKLEDRDKLLKANRSLPSRERELKLPSQRIEKDVDVAPLAGA